MAGYHIHEIPNGVLGEFSKIVEEFLEFEDAMEQSSVVMALVELSDLVGAIEAFLVKNGHNSLFKKLIEEVKSNKYYVIDYADLKESFSVLNQAVKEKDYSKFEIFLAELNFYVKQFNLTITDLHIMSEITKRAFITGCRPSKS